MKKYRSYPNIKNEFLREQIGYEKEVFCYVNGRKVQEKLFHLIAYADTLEKAEKKFALINKIEKMN